MAASNGTSSLLRQTIPYVPPRKNIKLSMKECRKLDELGRGSYGTVWSVMAPGGWFLAVKEVSLSDKGTKQLEQEIALLSKFQHKNIVQYCGTDKDESKLYIFLELVTQGSIYKLYSKLSRFGECIPDLNVSIYTRQILQGLRYLHDHNVIHRDIKCENILVDASGSVKLADFGVAKITEGHSHSFCGSPYWMAPEVVKRTDQGYGIAADIWSLGCTVLEMLTGKFPYGDQLELYPLLCKISRGVLPEIPASLPMHPRDFIQKCLKFNPQDRPTAIELLDHPFVQEAYARMTNPPVE